MSATFQRMFRQGSEPESSKDGNLDGRGVDLDADDRRQENEEEKLEHGGAQPGLDLTRQLKRESPAKLLLKQVFLKAAGS